MIASALHRGTPGAESTGRLPARWTRRRSALGRLAALALAASSVTLAAGCAATTRPAATASPRPPASASRPVSVLSQPVTPPPVAPGGTAAPPAPQASPPAPASGYAGPHFDTPQAAMAYLASAYNSDNTTALHAVTEPRAFRALMGMRSEAVNLRLTRCTPNPRGDYTCYFWHDYPASLHKSGHGAAEFIAAPALNPGWYMYQFSGCG